MTDEEVRLFVEQLSKIPNPCCGIPGPCKMYGPGAEAGPVCHCKKPSAYEGGLCEPCGRTLGMRPPDGFFVEPPSQEANEVSAAQPPEEASKELK